ncbi:hypothetical protein EDC04DRAFT_2208720 [Pisolithus marmoratus]|nr:hypothetical protein EDC04DRAFT_2208720 [Pisolithus marmoratus]
MSRVIETTENLLRNLDLKEGIGSTLQGRIPSRGSPVKINPPLANNSTVTGIDVGSSPPALQIPTMSAVASSEIDVKPTMTSPHTGPHVKSEHEDPPLLQGPLQSTSAHPVDGQRMTETPLEPNSKQSHSMGVQNTGAGPSSAVPQPAPTKPQPKRVRKPEISKLLARDLDWYKSTMAGTAPTQLPQVSLTSVEPGPTPMDIDAAPPAFHGQVVQAISVKQEITPGVKRVAGVSSSPQHDGVTTAAIAVESDSFPQPASGPTPVPASAPGPGPFHVPSEDNCMSTRTIADHTPSLPPPPPPAPSFRDMPSTEIHNENLPVSATTCGESSSPILSPSSKHSHDTSVTQPRGTTTPPAATADSDSPSFPPHITGSEFLPDRSPAKTESSASPVGTGNDEHSLPPPPFEPPQRASVTGGDTHPSTLPSQAERPVQPEEFPLNGDLSHETFHEGRIVMYFTKGDTLPRAHHVNLTISEEMHSNVSRWVNRKTSLKDVSSSFCVSVACYRLCDLGTATESSSNEDNLSIPEATAHAPCSWPTSMHLMLNLKCGGKNWSLPLSPPFKVTPDQFMDISSLVQSGENTLQIIQYGDLSDYVFVIHAHHPTGAQLAELRTIHAADQKWRTFLDSMCAPVELGPSSESIQELPMR